MIGKLMVLALIILNILAILDVLKSRKEKGYTVLWIFVIIFLPVIGIILYFIAGKK